MSTELYNKIFDQCIADYHVHNSVHHPIHNPYGKSAFEYLLYLKNWIDTVQWHLEDIIRDPLIDPARALEIKRWIDRSNQERTDVVEYIDSYFLDQYKNITPGAGATMNTESPAWAIDRLSILALKIYHMREEATRPDATPEHRDTCQRKLDILLEQRQDLGGAITQLLEDIAAGQKIYESVQADEDVQRSYLKSGALQGEITYA